MKTILNILCIAFATSFLVSCGGIEIVGGPQMGGGYGRPPQGPPMNGRPGYYPQQPMPYPGYGGGYNGGGNYGQVIYHGDQAQHVYGNGIQSYATTFRQPKIGYIPMDQR